MIIRRRINVYVRDYILYNTVSVACTPIRSLNSVPGKLRKARDFINNEQTDT